MSGDVLASARLLRPAPLLRFVEGDSAVKYAMRCERASRWATWLSNGGALAVLGALAAIYVRDRNCGPVPYPFGNCRDGDAVHMTAGVLAVGGAAALYVSIPFARRASSNHTRALWWNNARFAR